MYLLMDCKIIDFEIVEGSSLKANWRNDMQVITTDKGKFIDNLSGKKFAKSIKYAEQGYNWSDNIGQTVKECKIISNSDFFWINKAS